MIRVLYVDDESSLLDIGKLFLEVSGNFSVSTAESAAAALALLKTEPFDAIVSDYQMPGMDGIRFLIEVRAEFGEIPFILFTGRGREEIVIQAINSGADFYLQKGGDPGAQFAELSHKIRAAVAQHTNALAFKASEERFRAISEYSHTAICIIDERAKIVWANDKMLELGGYPLDQLYGTESFVSFLAPESIGFVVSNFQKVLRGEPYEHHYSFYFIRADGEKRLCEKHMMDVMDSHGRRNLIISMLDVTDRKRAEEELIKKNAELNASFEQIKASEEKLRQTLDELTRQELALFDSERELSDIIMFLPDATFVIDISGTVIAWNRAMEEMTGIKKEDMIGKGDHAYAIPFYSERRPQLLDLIDIDDEEIRSKYQYVRRKEKTLYAETFCPALYGGRGAYVWATGSPLFDAGRNRIGAIESIRDITGRKQVEEALIESSRKYAELFELGGEAIFLIDNESGALLEANAAASEMYGYSYDAFLSMKYPDLSAEKEDTGKILTKTPQGTIREPLRHHRRNDGTVFPVEILGRFFIWNKRPVQIAAIRDISERERAEEVLRESRDRFEQISEQSREMVWEVDSVGLYTYVSPASTEIIGFSPEELVGNLHFYDLYPEDGREAFRASTLEDFAQRKVLCDIINLRQTKDGQIIWMSTNGMPIFDEFNNFLGYRGSDSDISERRQAEEIRTRFGRILESSLNEIYFFDAQTLRFVDVNHGARENTGYTMDELRTKTPLDITAEYTKESFEALLSPLRTGEKEILVFFAVNKRKDGSLYPVEVHLQLSKKEVLPLFVAIIRDITERRQTEEALRLANWKLNLLSGITRHDINNQMTVLRGYLNLLEIKPVEPHLNEYIAKMDAAARRISSMIQFTREYDEIGVTLPLWQDIHTLVNDAAKDVSFGDIQLKNDLPAGMEVFAEPLIFKVFYNLMDNAVRYGDTIRTIRFFLKERSGDRIIMCEDDGIGIPAAEKEKIFLRGFGKNTGLGLALTQEILEITGMSIEETGEAGKGARFEMSVPKGMWRISRK